MFVLLSLFFEWVVAGEGMGMHSEVELTRRFVDDVVEGGEA